MSNTVTRRRFLEIAGACAAGAALFGGAAVAGSRSGTYLPKGGAKMNVVLVNLDSLRRDYVGARGPPAHLLSSRAPDPYASTLPGVALGNLPFMAALTPQAFAKRWGASALSERSSYQQHFLDLCEMLGAPKPADVDPTGGFYAFEKGVEKTGGGKGFADVWYKDRFAVEYKGKHKDLGAAYGQLLQYRESLENPPLLVVTDVERFEVHTNFTGAVAKVFAFTNAELPEPENLRILRAPWRQASGNSATWAAWNRSLTMSARCPVAVKPC